MMDVFNVEMRSAGRRAVKSTDTTAEMKVRRLLHGVCYGLVLGKEANPV
ncbi:MAG: hypothetical protein WCD76_01600 [Pyrinomonadaceae bacterium]